MDFRQVHISLRYQIKCMYVFICMYVQHRIQKSLLFESNNSTSDNQKFFSSAEVTIFFLLHMLLFLLFRLRIKVNSKVLKS